MLDQDLPPDLAGEGGERQDVVAGLVQMGGGGLGVGLERGDDLGALGAWTEAGSGCSNMVRTRVETHGWAVLGTRVSRLRW